MADVYAEPPALSGRRGKVAEHWFFSGYMVAVALILFAGFAPSLFLRGFIQTPMPLRPFRPDIIVHALVATPLVLLLPLQAVLISARQVRMHVIVGRLGFGLGALLIPILYLVGSYSYRLAPPQQLPFAAAMSSLVLLALPAVAALLAVAWRERFNAQAHKRLMVAFACLLTGPALSRMPIFPPPPGGVAFTEVAVLLLLAPLWMWDVVTQSRVHWATLTGTAIIGAQTAVRLLVMDTTGWADLVARLPAYGS
jgi:hypothetical protein